MRNLNYDILSEEENRRAETLNELIEMELSTQDEKKLKKLYLAAITLFNSHYSSIVYDEYYRTICEVFNLPLDNSEFVSKTAEEYNRLSHNIRKLEIVLYKDTNSVVDSYVNRNLEEEKGFNH